MPACAMRRARPDRRRATATRRRHTPVRRETVAPRRAARCRSAKGWYRAGQFARRARGDRCEHSNEILRPGGGGQRAGAPGCPSPRLRTPRPARCRCRCLRTLRSASPQSPTTPVTPVPAGPLRLSSPLSLSPLSLSLLPTASLCDSECLVAALAPWVTRACPPIARPPALSAGAPQSFYAELSSAAGGRRCPGRCPCRRRTPSCGRGRRRCPRGPWRRARRRPGAALRRA